MILFQVHKPADQDEEQPVNGKPLPATEMDRSPRKWQSIFVFLPEVDIKHPVSSRLSSQLKP